MYVSMCEEEVVDFDVVIYDDTAADIKSRDGRVELAMKLALPQRIRSLFPFLCNNHIFNRRQLKQHKSIIKRPKHLAKAVSTVPRPHAPPQALCIYLQCSAAKCTKKKVLTKMNLTLLRMMSRR